MSHVNKPDDGNKHNHQKGRQQGSQGGGDARFSNDQQFYRQPGQGMRGNEGGQREESKEKAQDTTGSDTRKKSRPENER